MTIEDCEPPHHQASDHPPVGGHPSSQSAMATNETLLVLLKQRKDELAAELDNVGARFDELRAELLKESEPLEAELERVSLAVDALCGLRTRPHGPKTAPPVRARKHVSRKKSATADDIASEIQAATTAGIIGEAEIKSAVFEQLKARGLSLTGTAKSYPKALKQFEEKRS